MLKKAMIYLGLGPDEHYEAYDDTTHSHSGVPRTGQHASSYSYPNPQGRASERSTVADPNEASLGRTVRPVPIKSGYDDYDPDSEVQSVRPHPSNSPSRSTGRPMSGKPHAVSPKDFHHAKEIGDRFKSGQAVIVNLQSVDRDLRRRLVDFASGLCYGRDGKMDRVADQVYLLTPIEIDSSRSKTTEVVGI